MRIDVVVVYYISLLVQAGGSAGFCICISIIFLCVLHLFLLYSYLFDFVFKILLCVGLKLSPRVTGRSGEAIRYGQVLS